MVCKLSSWIFLIPLLLNGLWVVCETAPSQQASPEAAECAKMCPMNHAANAGAVCLLLPGASQKTLTVIDFGVAILTPEVHLEPRIREQEFAHPVFPTYSSPSLSHHTPPPKI
jgi:hypothetical protein